MQPSSYEVDALGASVEVIVDTWGVPHIYARSLSDVFVAQGFNAARERLFQLDLWRREGLGLLSEAFGEQFVAKDRAARLFLYRGDMQAEYAAYGGGVKSIVDPFVTGINAFIGYCELNPAALPAEFALCDYRPARWDADDIFRIRTNGLHYNLDHEVARGRVIGGYGLDVEQFRRKREPADSLVVPEGIDLTALPQGLLDVYRLAIDPVTFTGDAVRAEPISDVQGSNNWVVSAERTATGRPILASDPHRLVTLPSLRYVVHLSAPGVDVIGAGEPALPGVSIGHNASVAFAFTIFPVDQEDLYAYETRLGSPREYRYGTGWEAMTVRIEAIPVRGKGVAEAELVFTRHGPVIYEDPARNRAWAVRAAWLEPGMAPYLGSAGHFQARDAGEFASRLRSWGGPGENHVYADTSGNIGWRPAGKVPVRPNWDGSLPVPGDGRYEWAGFHDPDTLPQLRNPAEGWLATANQMNLPDSYPNAAKTVTYDWYPPHRYERIAQALRDKTDLALADCVALQTDYLSLPAAEIVESLHGIESGNPAVAAALAQLKAWNCTLDAGSSTALIFEVWYRRHLRPALLKSGLQTLLGGQAADAALSGVYSQADVAGDPRVDLEVLREVSRDRTHYARIVQDSLQTALDEIRAMPRPDGRQRTWGELHRAELRHPLFHAVESPPAWMHLGPLPRGGSRDTVGAADYTTAFIETVGASFRAVLDVGQWDNSVFMNTPGQSGRPESAHYSDLFRPWAADAAVPLLFSREAVETSIDYRFWLLPARTSQATATTEIEPTSAAAASQL